MAWTTERRTKSCASLRTISDEKDTETDKNLRHQNSILLIDQTRFPRLQSMLQNIMGSQTKAIGQRGIRSGLQIKTHAVALVRDLVQTA
jgi:hypothetical protein